jgi:hypothetical protein
VVGIPEAKMPLVRPGHREKDIIYLNEIGCEDVD